MRSIRTVVGMAAIAFMAATATTTFVPAPANAATVEGKACKKAGTTQGDGPNRTVICTKVTKGKNKGKLFWQLISGSSSKPGCATRPIFTKDFIDPDHVQVVVPIGQQTASGGVLSVRSYVHSKPALDGQQLPLYAPVDMTLVQAAYYKIGTDPAYKPEYSLFFDAGCGIMFQLYHVKGVVGAVSSAVPKNPVPSSAGQQVTATRIKAGEQIGWFQGEAGKSVAFDLRMEDSSHTNSFINQNRFTSSPGASGELHAVCPYDFYSGTQRQRWLAKLGAPSSDPVPGTPCGVVSQGEAGSAQGMWFFKDAKVNELTYRGTTWNDGMPAGQYQSQIVFSVDPSGTVRIGGLNASAPIMQMMIGKLGPGSDTWRDPLSVRSGGEQCWSNSSQSVKVRMSADGAALTAVVGTKPCALLDLSRGQTYVR